MKRLPEIRHSWTDIHQIVMGDLQSHLLTTAIRLKIFDLLIRPATAEQVAENLHFQPRNTELYLNALAGMKLIQKQHGLFSNSEKSAVYLVSSNPCYLGAFFLHYRQWHEQLHSSLEQLLQSGPPEQQMEMSDGAIWAESARLSAAYQYCGSAQAMAHIAAAQPEFSKMTTMLDLGGGAGFFAQAIVAAHPTMTGVIFEQPSVAAVARDFLKAYDAETRIHLREGNYMTDALDGPYDLIFASATLNFYKDQLEALFAKVCDALTPGGIFMTHQDGLYAERTQPANLVAEFLSIELCGGDFAMPQGMIAETMLTAGFQSVRSFPLFADAGEMEITIGRKAL